jgi:MFS family permease
MPQKLPPFAWSRRTGAQKSALIAAALGWMLDSFDVMLYTLVLARLMTVFGMSSSTAGALAGVTLIASAIGALLFGWLADRHGRARMLMASVATYSVFTAACGFADSIALLALFRFLLGLGMGGEWNTGAALVAETWPADVRGRALGVVQSSWAVGYALAAALGNTVFAYWNWRAVFFLGLAPAALILLIQARVPEPEEWQHEHSRRAHLGGSRVAGTLAADSAERVIARDTGSGALRPHAAAPGRGFTRALRVARGFGRDFGRNGVVLLAMNCFGMFAWWGLFLWLPSYLELPLSAGGRGFHLLSASYFLVVLNLAGMLPGYLLFGWFADRFGRRRTLVAYLSLAAALIPAFALARTPGAILLAASLVAFFGTGFFTGSGIIGSELFPTAIRALALGITYNGARVFGAIAPVAIGALARTHGLAVAFLLCGAGFALAALFAAALPETKRAAASA